MTVEPSCIVCGKPGPAINGLCYDCTLKELFNPGAAFQAMFGSLNGPTEPPATGQTGADEEIIIDLSDPDTRAAYERWQRAKADLESNPYLRRTDAQKDAVAALYGDVLAAARRAGHVKPLD